MAVLMLRDERVEHIMAPRFERRQSASQVLRRHCDVPGQSTTHKGDDRFNETFREQMRFVGYLWYGKGATDQCGHGFVQVVRVQTIHRFQRTCCK